MFNIFILIYMIKIILNDDSNSLINTETLTSIIKYSLSTYESTYATLATTPKGNLICSSSFYQDSTMKYYYGLKPNGRPYFTKDGVETEFSNTDSDKVRNEGNIYGVQLSGTSDDKEYIIAIGNNNADLEIYDFSLDNPVIFSKPVKDFFAINYNTFKYLTIFKLKNGDNFYLISIILQNNGDYVNYFHIYKIQFASFNYDTNYPIISQNSYKVDTGLYFTSCYETDSNYIICFFIYKNSYTYQYIYNIQAYDYNLYNVLQTSTIENAKYDAAIFYKCIHFTNNAGVFIYFNSEGNICIQFKNYESNIFSSYFNNNDLNPIIINNEDYYDTVSKNDLIKIGDKKFCYITVSKDNEKLNLFMFNNFINEKFIIRHYTVRTSEKNNFKFGQELRASLYNDYIALATVGYLNSESSYSYVIIFNYPNSIDFSLDITETLKSSEIPVINLLEKCKIENNIFGYETVGVQLQEISNGLKLLNEEDKTTINKNDIFNKNVELYFNEDIDFSSNLRIEFAFVVKDPPYSLYKDYSEIIKENLCGDSCQEEENYHQVNHIGRTSYFDIIIDSNEISNNCDEYCFICIKNTQECLFCKESFWKSNNDKKKCTNIIPPTTISIIPTSTILEQEPTTIPIKIPNTIPIEIPTTIPIEIHSTIPTAIISTIPNEKNYEIPSTMNDVKEDISNTDDLNHNCTINEIINNECQNAHMTINQIEEIKNQLLNQDYNGENTIITTETVIIQLSKLDDQLNQDNANVSNIDLGDCEGILRSENNIEDDEDLIVYKTDIKSSDLSSTYVVYEVYDSSLNKLNLDVCSDTQISIHVPVQLDETLDSLAKSLSDSGYNLFNENDSFYNDICSTYTNEDGTDMLLSDRKSDIYSSTQNQSICQTECELESYNATSKKAKCICDVSATSTISTLNIDNLFNKKIIAESFYDTLANSNFLVMKCYKLVLDFSSIWENYGQIVMTILAFFFLVMMVIYCILGNKKIHQFLYTILKNTYKKNKFEEESVAESNDKKVIHEINRRKNRNSKTDRKIKFKNKNAPPKKKRNKNENSNDENEDDKNIRKNKVNFIKISKIVTSTNDLVQVKSEININRRNKNKKNKKFKEEKIIYSGEKELNTKKNMKETEENNKKEIFETGIGYDKIYFNDTELENLEYELAIIYDRRTYFQYYWAVLKQNQLIIFTFLPMDDFNLMYVKIALFIISFGLFITINGFFFSDDTMHKVYEDKGVYDIIYQIPQIFYSSIISSFANILLKNLSLSENSILELKKEIYNGVHKAKIKARRIERCLRIKLILFFIISLILMIFFWYFISCFCAVYKNTQIILLKDTGISFGASMIYPLILSFLPGIFRIPSLRNRNLKGLYRISSIINWLI